MGRKITEDEAQAIGELLKAPPSSVVLTEERIDFLHDVVQDFPELSEPRYKSIFPMPTQ